MSSPETSPSGVTGTARVKRGMAEMLKGGVIMDVVDAGPILTGRDPRSLGRT